MINSKSFQTLADAGITPSHTKTYTRDEIEDALSQAHGAEVTVRCRNHNLNELWYYFNVAGSLQTGKFVSSNPGSFPFFPPLTPNNPIHQLIAFPKTAKHQTALAEASATYPKHPQSIPTPPNQDTQQSPPQRGPPSPEKGTLSSQPSVSGAAVLSAQEHGTPQEPAPHSEPENHPVGHATSIYLLPLNSFHREHLPFSSLKPTN